MTIFHDIAQLATLEKKLHLAMGVFDGVHLGHHKVIQEAVSAAHETGEYSGVVTFDPFPIQVIAPDRAPQRILANLSHKQRLLSALEVDIMLVIPFDKDYAQLSAEAFLDQFSETQQVVHISVGEDWKFGKSRQGTIHYLREYGKQKGIRITATAPVMDGGERISSTRIRQAVRDGNLSSTSAMLGRQFSVFGNVIKGRQLGRTIGFPTANIDCQNELMPPLGVYAVHSVINGELVHGVANLGVRPTVTDIPERVFEVHFFSLDQDLYNEELEVILHHYIRPELKFASLEALQEQIRQDCEDTKKYFLDSKKS